MNVVIYARFSSHSQTEQSIEGQLRVCYEYAKAHNYTVVGEYIDRAQSGTSDNRQSFQKMIQDSEKKTFQFVLVYQLDRFARNRYDSAIHNAKLKKNGVRVLSAKENITDDASGILIEGVLESIVIDHSSVSAKQYGSSSYRTETVAMLSIWCLIAFKSPVDKNLGALISNLSRGVLYANSQ